MNQDKITVDDLDGEQREIAECVGIENYLKLVEHFGGMSVYFLKEESLLKEKRNRQILKMFNGGNYKEIAKKFNLSENRVRSIIFENLN